MRVWVGYTGLRSRSEEYGMGRKAPGPKQTLHPNLNPKLLLYTLNKPEAYSKHTTSPRPTPGRKPWEKAGRARSGKVT